MHSVGFVSSHAWRMHCRTGPGCDEFGLGEEGCWRDSRRCFGWQNQGGFRCFHTNRIKHQWKQVFSNVFDLNEFMNSWILIYFDWILMDSDKLREDWRMTTSLVAWDQSVPATFASSLVWIRRPGDPRNWSNTGVQQSLWLILGFYQSQVWIFADSQSILLR